MQPVILIPAYEPTASLLTTLKDLRAAGFEHFVVVNDGSGPESQPFFQQAAALSGVKILTHAVNCGKGRALKTGFNYILSHYPQSVGAIACDCDGQHPVKAVLDCADALSTHPNHLILGCRTFFHPSEKRVPFLNLMGNLLSRCQISFACGTIYDDVQCGLRGYPPSVMRALLNVPGERFEFENNTFPALRRAGIPVCEFAMDAVYPASGHVSHFKKVRDTLRIQRGLMPYYMPEVYAQLAALLLIELFYPLYHLFHGYAIYGFALLVYTLVHLVMLPPSTMLWALPLGIAEFLLANLISLLIPALFPVLCLTALISFLPVHWIMLYLRFGKRPRTLRTRSNQR